MLFLRNPYIQPERSFEQDTLFLRNPYIQLERTFENNVFLGAALSAACCVRVSIVFFSRVSSSVAIIFPPTALDKFVSRTSLSSAEEPTLSSYGLMGGDSTGTLTS